MATSRTGINGKPLSISAKLNIINKVDVVLNLPHTKTAEPLWIPLKKVTDKMLSQKQVRIYEVCCKLHKFGIQI